MVPQTCGCACARPAKARLSRAARRMRIEAVMWAGTISRSAAERGRVTLLQIGILNLNARCAAVGARIVAAFQRAVRMQDDGAGVAHGVGIGFTQYRNVMTGRHQPVDQPFVEALLQPQIRVARTPGTAQEPARRIERLFERLAE